MVHCRSRSSCPAHGSALRAARGQALCRRCRVDGRAKPWCLPISLRRTMNPASRRGKVRARERTNMGKWVRPFRPPGEGGCNPIPKKFGPSLVFFPFVGEGAGGGGGGVG